MFNRASIAALSLLLLAGSFCGCRKQPTKESIFADLRSGNIAEAWDALWDMGPEARSIIPDMMKVIQDQNEEFEVRILFIGALFSIAQHAEEVVPDLIAIATDKNELEKIREFSFMTLGAIGVKKSEQIDALLGVLTDKSESIAVRRAVLRVKCEEFNPELIKILKGNEEELKKGIPESLGRFGPVAKEALPALREALEAEEAKGEEKDEKFIWDIKIALSRIDI